MSVKPFRGIHFNLEKVFLKQVISPIAIFEDSILKEQLKMNSQHNILHLLSEDNSDNKLYKEWVNDKILIKANSPKIYIYEQQFEQDDEVLKRTSFIALYEYDGEKNVELPYIEDTNNKGIINSSNGLNIVPSIGLYEDENKKINKILNQAKKDMPLISTIDCCKVKNTVWIIESDETIKEICDIMEEKNVITTFGYDDKNKMVAFVNIYDEGVKLFNNYRLLRTNDIDMILKKLKLKFNIIELNEQDFDGISVKLNGTNYGLILEDEFIEKLHPLYRKFNTYILHEIIFNELLDLKNNFINFELFFVDEEELKDIEKPNDVVFKVGRLANDTLSDLFKTEYRNLGKGIKCYPDLQMGLIMYDGI